MLVAWASGISPLGHFFTIPCHQWYFPTSPYLLSRLLLRQCTLLGYRLPQRGDLWQASQSAAILLSSISPSLSPSPLIFSCPRQASRRRHRRALLANLMCLPSSPSQTRVLLLGKLFLLQLPPLSTDRSKNNNNKHHHQSNKFISMKPLMT